MSRKRSTYRPRYTASSPLMCLTPISKEQLDGVMRVFLSALEVMAKGSEPRKQEWEQLSDVCNLVETLALHTHHLNPELVMPALTVAKDGMRAAAKRVHAGRRLGIDGATLNALRKVISFYQEAAMTLSERDMLLSFRDTQRRVTALQRLPADQIEVVSL